MNEIALSWAYTGDLRSKAHIAVVEPFQVDTLCGVNIARGGMNEIRPLSTEWCERCVREARKRGVEAWEIGIENDLRSES